MKIKLQNMKIILRKHTTKLVHYKHIPYQQSH